MNIKQLLKIIISFFIAVSYAHAAETYNIIDRGMDMDTRYYSVACPDGTNSSVSIQFDIQAKKPIDEKTEAAITMTGGGTRISPPKILQVCIFPLEGEGKCKSSWDLKKAAKASCS